MLIMSQHFNFVLLITYMSSIEYQHLRCSEIYYYLPGAVSATVDPVSVTNLAFLAFGPPIIMYK